MSPSIEPLRNFDQLRDDLLPGERIFGMKARHGELTRYGKIHEIALKGLGRIPWPGSEERPGEAPLHGLPLTDQKDQCDKGEMAQVDRYDDHERDDVRHNAPPMLGHWSERPKPTTSTLLMVWYLGFWRSYRGRAGSDPLRGLVTG